jgi:hypothetical protein
MSTKIVSPSGFVYTLTVRDGADKAAIADVVRLVKDIEGDMVEKGYTGYERPYRRKPAVGANGNGHTSDGHANGNGHTSDGHANGNGHTSDGHANGNGHTSDGHDATVKGKLVDAYLAEDGTPVCAIHGTPLTPSKHHPGYYCARHGQGPNGWCTARYETETD